MSTWRPSTISVLVGIVACLITIGVIILYSATGMPGMEDASQLKRQLLWIGLGTVAFLVTSHLDYRIWRQLAIPVAVFSLILLAMVITPGVGTAVKGSTRWLQLGPIRFQPSETAKVASVILLAWWMARIQRNPQTFKRGLVVPCSIIGAFAVLIMAEPDYGATMLIGSVGMAIMFVAGTRPSYLFLAGMSGLAAMALMIAQNAERLARISAFLDPQAHADTDALQLIQAVFAFVGGGAHGVGLGNSVQKRHYLPEAHTDFIFPILGEELGLWGSMSVLLLFLGFFACGMKITASVEDRFGKLLAFGLTLMITVQAALNIGVVTGSLPTKGITLPFISFGGTSMVVSLAMVGILVNVAMTAPLQSHVLDSKSRRLRAVEA